MFNKTKVLFVLSAAAKLSANLSFRPVRTAPFSRLFFRLIRAALFSRFSFRPVRAALFPRFSFRPVRAAPFSRLSFRPVRRRPAFPAFRPLPGRTCRNILNFCLENLQCLII